MIRPFYDTPRAMRGGTSRVVYRRDDTKETVDVEAHVLPAGGSAGELGEDQQVETTAAGTSRVERIDRSLACVIADRAKVETLERWSKARAPVRAIALGLPEGGHRVWDEPARLLIEAADGPFGQVTGHLVTLRTAKYYAAVALSDDLDALDAWEDLDLDGVADAWETATSGFSGTVQFLGGGIFAAPGAREGWQEIVADAGRVLLYRDVVLPAPGLRVRHASILTGGAAGESLLDDPGDDSAVRLRVEAWPYGPVPTPDFSETPAREPLAAAEAAITAEGEGFVWLDLPARTHTVRRIVEIDAGTSGLAAVQVRKPRLYTRREAGDAVLNGGFLLTAEDADSFTIQEFGSATIEEASVTGTFLGDPYQLDLYTLGPDGLTDVLVTDSEAWEHAFHLATTTPGS